MADVRDRILSAFGLVRNAIATARAQEALSAGYELGAEDEPASSTLRRYGYKRNSSGQRELTSASYEELMQTAWDLWQSNPMAKRVLAIKRDYIVGRGVTYQCGDEALRRVLDKFWRRNKMRRRAKEFAHQLYLLGSQCYPLFVRESDGRVTLGYIDPDAIEAIICDPGNALDWCAVVLKQSNEQPQPWEAREDARQVYRIAREEDDESNEHFGRVVTHEQATLQDWELVMLSAFGLEHYTGTCIYDRVNAVSNQPRGVPDLAVNADWLDLFDEVLFALGEREQMAGYMSWDVSIDSDETAVKERASQIRLNPPKRGSVNVHNKAEEWKLEYPDLKQQGSVETANAISTNIMGGAGLPNHFYGRGDETNRATAQAQGDPTWRSLEHDQDVVDDMLTLILEFARDQAIIAQALPAAIDETQAVDELVDALVPVLSDYEITLVLPEMTAKDTAGIASALSALASALMIAQDKQWISEDTARETFAKVLRELDIEVDLDEEAEDVEQAGEIAIDSAIPKPVEFGEAGWLESALSAEPANEMPA